MQADSLPAESQGKPKNTGLGSLSLLQWIFLTQKSNRVSCIAGGLFTNRHSHFPWLLGYDIVLGTFISIYLFFNWRIIALQNFVVFCQTSTWISHGREVQKGGVFVYLGTFIFFFLSNWITWQFFFFFFHFTYVLQIKLISTCVYMLSHFSHFRTVTCQAPLSMGFSRQEY